LLKIVKLGRRLKSERWIHLVKEDIEAIG